MTKIPLEKKMTIMPPIPREYLKNTLRNLKKTEISLVSKKWPKWPQKSLKWLKFPQNLKNDQNSPNSL